MKLERRFCRSCADSGCDRAPVRLRRSSRCADPLIYLFASSVERSRRQSTWARFARRRSQICEQATRAEIGAPIWWVKREVEAQRCSAPTLILNYVLFERTHCPNDGLMSRLCCPVNDTQVDKSDRNFFLIHALHSV